MSWAKDRFDRELELMADFYHDPCVFCDCYDPDRGCTMPSLDMSYACPLREEPQYTDGWHEVQPDER